MHFLSEIFLLVKQHTPGSLLVRPLEAQPLAALHASVCQMCVHLLSRVFPVMCSCLQRHFARIPDLLVFRQAQQHNSLFVRKQMCFEHSQFRFSGSMLLLFSARKHFYRELLSLWSLPTHVRFLREDENNRFRKNGMQFH